MQQGLQELSKEEREELVQRRMDDMRRKNEELLRRYAEIEADKKNADLFSSSAIKEPAKKSLTAHKLDENEGTAEHVSILQDTGPPKPLRRPHAVPVEKPLKVHPSEERRPTPAQNEERRSHRANAIHHEERRTQRLSADDHPPPDPGFRFLADRMREQEEEEGGVNGSRLGTESRGHSQRNRRNYGGRDFENVRPTMRLQRDMEREHPESPPRNLAMQMTGRQRREYEQWKCDRQRIDQERLQRHMTASGEFKREWDHNKEEQEDLPPQPGRKFGDQSHSYGSRIFSRGGRRGNRFGRGPHRGGHQETARDRAESSGSARSDLSSETELLCNRPRSNRHAVPTREHVPVQDFDAMGEQRTILRNYDQRDYHQRNYNRGPEQRNSEPMNDSRSRDFAEFERRGRGRERGSWEERRKPRGREWGGGRGGRGPRGRAMGSRGLQPSRHGSERREGERKADSDEAVEDMLRRNQKQLPRKMEDVARSSAVAEGARNVGACYENWDVSGQKGGGGWGEGKEDSHDDGWEDALSHPHHDDADDNNVEDEDDDFETNNEHLVEQGEGTELTACGSVHKEGHEEGVDIGNMDVKELAEKKTERNAIRECSERDAVANDEGVRVDEVEMKENALVVEEGYDREGSLVGVIQSSCIAAADDMASSPAEKQKGGIETLNLDGAEAETSSAGVSSAATSDCEVTTVQTEEVLSHHKDVEQTESSESSGLRSEMQGISSPLTVEGFLSHEDIPKDNTSEMEKADGEWKVGNENNESMPPDKERTDTSAGSKSCT